MQKLDSTNYGKPGSQFITGKPTIPFIGRHSIIERKTYDPSSSPKGERYPIPSFSNYRVISDRSDIQ